MASKQETTSQMYFRWARSALETARACPAGSPARQLHLLDAAAFRATAKRYRHPQVERAIDYVAGMYGIPVAELRTDYAWRELPNGDVEYAYRHTNSGVNTVRAAVISKR